MYEGFSHIDSNGNAYMVDVTGKGITNRIAVAQGEIVVNKDVFDAIKNNEIAKGDVLGVARVAGIMAAKETSRIIPMCHNLMLNKCAIDFFMEESSNTIKAVCTVKVSGETGVEMEALTGVSVSLLTIYDMCKAIDKSMEIQGICLVSKSGGKSGDYININKKTKEE